MPSYLPIISAAALLATFSLTACNKKGDSSYPATPELTYRYVSANQVSYSDTGRWNMYYDFVDGDGDIGTDYTDSDLAVTVTNITTGAVYKFPFPYVPASARMDKTYLKGSGSLSLTKNVFFIPRADSAHRQKDTFQFEMYVTDQAGNQSNTISSPPIFITP